MLIPITVYMMANIEKRAKASCRDPLLDSEKQDVCHLATMLMEVGMGLAGRAEDDGGNVAGESSSSSNIEEGHLLKKRKL
jgi:hypothetical protein